MKALTTMQAAYWVGRQSEAPLGGVSAHLYAEFNGCDLDVERLRQAVTALYLHHPMLRLRITADGQQTIDACGPRHCLHIDDFRHAGAPEAANALSAKRRQKAAKNCRWNRVFPVISASVCCQTATTGCMWIWT